MREIADIEIFMLNFINSRLEKSLMFLDHATILLQFFFGNLKIRIKMDWTIQTNAIFGL